MKFELFLKKNNNVEYLIDFAVRNCYLNQNNIQYMKNIDNNTFINYLCFSLELPPSWTINNSYDHINYDNNDYEIEINRRTNNIWFMNVLLREKNIRNLDINEYIFYKLTYFISKLNKSNYEYKDLFIVDICKLILNNNSDSSKESLLKISEIKKAIEKSDNKSKLLEFFEIKRENKIIYDSDNALSCNAEIKEKHHNFYSLWKVYGWDMKNEGLIPKMLSDTVIKFVNEGEKNLVHEKLLPFIGKFEYENSEKLPYWWNEFSDKIKQHCYANSLVFDEYGNYTNEYSEILNILNYIKNNPSLINTGKIGYEKNSPKFSKFLQKYLKVKDINSLDWFKVYNTHRIKKNKVTIIGTKHPIKVMGMSSFTGGNWKSCQTLKNNYNDLARGLWSDVINNTCLVMYITDNEKVGFNGMENIKSEKMISRVIIRLIVDNNNNYGIFLDRIYPNYRTGQSIVGLVKQICKENNLFFYQKGDEISYYDIKTPDFKCLRLDCDINNDFITPYLDSACLNYYKDENMKYWCYHNSFS